MSSKASHATPDNSRALLLSAPAYPSDALALLDENLSNTDSRWMHVKGNMCAEKLRKKELEEGLS
jgi:hypothetical protein